jgi:hypothetical protein
MPNPNPSNIEALHQLNLRHGHAREGRRSPEYRAWSHMCDRCLNERSERYAAYGGRDIKVCTRWLKFENFLADMGERPTGRSLDRIDNNGNYEASNCRWATVSEQARNKNYNKLSRAEVHEIRMLLQRGYSQREVAVEFNVSQSLISKLINQKYWR